MRTIHKRSAPSELVEWRAPRMASHRGEGLECSYAELRRNQEVVNAVNRSLLAEQGGLCAYTGRRIDTPPAFHLEHLLPQDHCAYGESTDYQNLVACWPEPNHPNEPEYGARRKGNWPSRQELLSFVSPLDTRCSSRFTFSRTGMMQARDVDDEAAKATIERLNLDCDKLRQLRAKAIEGFMKKSGSLSTMRRQLGELQRVRALVDRGAAARLDTFCFALEAALTKKIKQLEGIRASR